MKPSNSTIASAGLGIPCAAVISWIINIATGQVMPGPVEASLGVIIGAAIGYCFKGGQRADTE